MNTPSRSEQPNGHVYESRLVDLLGRDPRADLDIAGKQLEEKVRAGVEAAEARSGKAVRQEIKPQRATGGAVRPAAI
jgi:hypothetical protein